MEIAEFLSFSRQQWLGTYKAVTLFSEVSGTPRPAMALKIAGWGVKAKVALDLLTIEPSGK